MSNWDEMYSYFNQHIAERSGPSTLSIQNAQALLGVLKYTKTSPSRVAPLADGGVIIWLDTDNWIECLDNGQVFISIP